MKNYRHDTIAGRCILDMQSKGYEFIGATSGWLSFRSNSNLSALLRVLKLKPEQVEVKCGAKKRTKSEGTELLVFVKDGGR